MKKNIFDSIASYCVLVLFILVISCGKQSTTNPLTYEKIEIENAENNHHDKMTYYSNKDTPVDSLDY